MLCVATQTQRLDRLGQLGEAKQEGNTPSEQKSNADSHSAQSKAPAAGVSTLCEQRAGSFFRSRPPAALPPAPAPPLLALLHNSRSEIHV